MGKLNRVGEIGYNKLGSKMEIISDNGCMDIDILFIEYNWVYKHARYDKFKNGSIKCPYEPRVFGIGYLGEGKYLAYINSKPTKVYNTWKDMLRRCYDDTWHIKKPTYKDCEVCNEWLNFQVFAEWYEKNYYEVPCEVMQLDKDILIKGNKLYSPETCVFVPNKINMLFVKHESRRGEYAIGVSGNASWCNKGIGRPVYLGTFSSENEAFKSYKQNKESYIKQVANELKKYIPEKLYKAMINYEVDIND